jgi:serine/threonine-protein kinase
MVAALAGDWIQEVSGRNSNLALSMEPAFWHRIRMGPDVDPVEDDAKTLDWTRQLRAVDKVFGDRYLLREMLGIGGMGAVVSALDTETGREVALKLLRTEDSRDTRERRMRREAEYSRDIGGSHVCRVDEMFFDGSEPFIVMERLHGETLRDRLRREGPPPFAEAIAIISDLLAALDAVHAAGVVHRDVKPANVFITEGAVKLIDFGLAARIGGAANDLRAESLNAFGTADYLPPERLLGQHEVHPSGDIWAAGMTLYAALTGTHPFLRDVWHDQVEATLLDDPPPVSELRSDVPPAIDDVILRALAKDNEWRFPTARAFGVALRAASSR